MNLVVMVVTAVTFLINSRLGALFLLLISPTLYLQPKGMCTSGF